MDIHDAILIADCPSIRVYKRKRDNIAEVEAKHNRSVIQLLQQLHTKNNVRTKSNLKRRKGTIQ